MSNPVLFLVFSLLSGAANGCIAIHDLHAVPPAADAVQCTYTSVCHVDVTNSCRHRGSVETIQWYPVDTGMFVSSSTDTYVKVWDTNVLQASNSFCNSFSLYFSLNYFQSFSDEEYIIACEIQATVGRPVMPRLSWGMQ
jgi:DNA excision repair protein ERCC-8